MLQQVARFRSIPEPLMPEWEKEDRVKTTFSKVRNIAKIAVLTSVLIAPTLAAAQDFPSKPVTIVIPFGPGGSNDTYGRVLAEKLGKLWKQTVVVENRAGAGSAIGLSLIHI